MLREGRDLVPFAPDDDLRRRSHEAGHAQAHAQRALEHDRHLHLRAVLGPVERRLAGTGAAVVLPAGPEPTRPGLVARAQVHEQRGVPEGEDEDRQEARGESQEDEDGGAPGAFCHGCRRP
jgi:hypothetical protein